MLLINLESRMKNKAFWIALLGAIVLLSQQLGFDISQFIPKNYVDVINTIFSILTILGIVVDTSTPGISDKVVQEMTIQAINKDTENANINTKEEVKTEDSATSINGEITENSQDSTINVPAPVINITYNGEQVSAEKLANGLAEYIKTIQSNSDVQS